MNEVARSFGLRVRNLQFAFCNSYFAISPPLREVAVATLNPLAGHKTRLRSRVAGVEASFAPAKIAEAPARLGYPRSMGNDLREQVSFGTWVGGVECRGFRTLRVAPCPSATSHAFDRAHGQACR